MKVDFAELPETMGFQCLIFLLNSESKLEFLISMGTNFHAFGPGNGSEFSQSEHYFIYLLICLFVYLFI